MVRLPSVREERERPNQVETVVRNVWLAATLIGSNRKRYSDQTCSAHSGFQTAIERRTLALRSPAVNYIPLT